MITNWNLDTLYTSFDSSELKQDIKALKDLVATFNTWATSLAETEASTKEVLMTYIEENTKKRTLSSRIGTFASLSFATDTKNSDATKLLDQVRQINAEFTLAYTLFYKYLKGLDEQTFTDSLQSDPLIQAHAFHIKELRDHTDYMLSDAEEVLLAKMKQTGSTAWSTLQNKVTANMTVEVLIDGEMNTLPLQAARNLAFNPDPAVRKAAFEAELKAYETYDVVSAATLNAIKGEVITESDLRGFTSPLEKTLFDSRMSKETLDAMLEAMNDAMPVFRAYFKRKGELLGHTNGLPFYDMFAPIGGKEKTITVEEARDIVLENFYGFSNELGDFAKKAFDNEWLDILPKEGKRGGAFCSNIPAVKESRFLLNFTGYLKNVMTMAHELGHGYHGEQIFNETLLNSSYPMPLAETASIFCETILKKTILKKTEPEDALGFIEASIQGYAQIIVDIYSRYLFETELFEQRKDSSLTANELNDIMIDAQKKAYGDGLNQEVLHPYMWMNKVHYYSAGRNFYNFPYAFGLLFAKGLYRRYTETGEDFIGKYNTLLRETGKNSIEAVAALMDIDVTKKAFWASSLAEITDEINTFMTLSEDLK